MYENGNPGPILPPWATSKMIDGAVDMLMRDILAHDEMINHTVKIITPVMISEAEAMLIHESEGWL